MLINNRINRRIEMKRMNKLLKVVTIISLGISFISFGTAAIGGLIDSSILMMFWYLGLTGIWVILMVSVVASLVFLFDFGGSWFQHQNFYRLKEHRHYPPHAAT
jgi:hypothetical protein